MAQTIQLRRGTAAEWTSANPVLAEGEIGVVTDSLAYKVGDGTTTWNALAYRELTPALETAQLSALAAEPATPAAGELYLYAKDVGGRVLPKFKGPSGLDSVLQPALFGNGVFLVAPGTTTAMQVIGGPALTVVGTMSHPTLTTSSLRQQTSRANVVSAATAASAAEVRAAFGRVWRGDAPGLGGFFFRCRFSIVSTTALQRTFVGLTNSTAAIATTQDPVALTNLVGVGNASADANLQILTNDGAGNAAKIDLGANFPSQGIDDVYELTMFAPPAGSTIKYRMLRIGTGAEATGTLSGAELPAASQFLAPHVYMNNGGTAAAVNFDLIRLYLETDY
jgi:hypothetical protein